MSRSGLLSGLYSGLFLGLLILVLNSCASKHPNFSNPREKKRVWYTLDVSQDGGDRIPYGRGSDKKNSPYRQVLIPMKKDVAVLAAQMEEEQNIRY